MFCPLCVEQNIEQIISVWLLWSIFGTKNAHQHGFSVIVKWTYDSYLTCGTYIISTDAQIDVAAELAFEGFIVLFF